MIILILLLFHYSLQDQVCPKIDCQSSQTQGKDDNKTNNENAASDPLKDSCGIYNYEDDIIQLHQCQEGYTCHIMDGINLLNRQNGTAYCMQNDTEVQTRDVEFIGIYFNDLLLSLPEYLTRKCDVEDNKTYSFCTDD